MTTSTKIPNLIETPVFTVGIQKILIVDDKDSNLFAMENVLEYLDAEVIRATSGQAALAKVLEHNFSVIVLDVRMPGMDGYEVAGHLKGDPQTKEIPIIFVTAEYPDEEHINKGYELGAIDYILKPYSPKILLSKVKVLLEMDRNKQELVLHRGHLEGEVRKRTQTLTQTNQDLQREISDRKQAEKDSEQEKGFSQNALDSLPGLFYLFEEDGQLLRVNKNFEIVSGYSAEELSHKNIQEFFDPVEWPTVEKEIIRVYEIGESSVEAEFLSKDETRTPCFFTGKRYDFDGKPCLLGMGVDISERKQAEAEKERLMAAINQAAESILITDNQGRIQYVNPAFERITGYSREEIIGKTPRILKSGEHPDTFYKELWQTLIQGKIWSGKITNRKKDGTLYTEEVTISPMKDDSGSIVNFVSVKRDVTAVLELEEQVRQSQKMESIGQLVGGVAHDFNNLLQIINGYTEMAQMMIEPGHPATSGLEEVSNAGNRAKDLVRQLLAFSRQQVIDPTYIDLNEEIENAKKMLGRVIGEHILLEFVPGKDLKKVFADKGQINQVLMNLCVNARDAMPDGGSLTLKTEHVQAAPDDISLHINNSPEGYSLLTVSDTGCGMKKEIREKIFDPFYTTKELGKGTGLGLSTVYGIVKQNNGAITVKSEPGKGTAFQIYFPENHPNEIEEGLMTEQSLVPVQGGPETILMAEDEEVLLALATHYLSKAGYKVLTAENGEEAVQVFREHADEIDLVMMDVVMPRMGGKKAMEEILEIRPGMLHLFVSGYSLDAGHNDFIIEKKQHLINKPYKPEVLLQTIRDLLDGKME